MAVTDSLRFLSHSKIVAIDNDKEHLGLITEGLLRIGLPTIPVHYDMVTGLNMPLIFEPRRIRILFLDLNLSDIENPSGTISTITEPIKEVLKELSPIGPYCIGFWTRHPDLVEKVMSQIVQRDENQEVPLPIKYVVIDKTPFLPIDGEHDPSALCKAIVSALMDHKVFLALLAWESEVEKAAAQTLWTVNELVRNPQSNGISLVDKDLVDVLKNLAIAAWGKKRAKADPGRAVTRGLTPLLMDHVDRIVGDNTYSQLWDEAITGGWNRPLPRCVPPAVLNSHCLVDLNIHSHDSRGAWLEFTITALNKRSLWKKYFGTTRVKLLEEFINPGKRRKATEIRNSVKLGLVECTAACDFFHDKAPLLRYIFCAMVPSEYEKYVFWEAPDRYKKHDAIHKIETISIEEKEYLLYLNFKFVLSLPPANDILKPKITRVALRVRSQVLTDITAKYASHTTRLGIYFFPSKPNR